MATWQRGTACLHFNEQMKNVKLNEGRTLKSNVFFSPDRKCIRLWRILDLLASLVLPSFSVQENPHTVNLYTKWAYKHLEIQQTHSIPFHWKRLKVALGKAVSTSCSNNLATTSSGQLSCMGKRGCVFCQVVQNGFLTTPFFLASGSKSRSPNLKRLL